MASVCKPVKVTYPAEDCPPGCQCKSVICPPGCLCKDSSNAKTKSKRIRLILNAVGILLAVFATYMIVSTDSKLYIVFWVCYSILRRLMVKNRASSKGDKIA